MTRSGAASRQGCIRRGGRPRASRLCAASLAALLAACGGGGSPDPAPGGPSIDSFTADRTQYLVGESAVLTARFTGGNARIEPGIGQVQSGVGVATPMLDAPASFRLIVTADGRSVERRLDLAVGFRDRYRAPASTFRAARHAAVLASDGGVIVIGGSRGESTVSYAVDRFDPATETFTRVGSLATGRESHTATPLPGGRILVVGGNSALNERVPAELVDERTGAVVATGTSVAERRGHAATLLANGDVLITGGYSNEGLPFGISDTAEIWSAATGEFRLLAARLGAPRAAHTATALPDGRVLIVGGFSPGAPQLFAELFDPATESFVPVPSNEIRQRGLHDAVRLSDGSVLVLGGEDSSESHASVLKFDPAAATFLTMPNLMRSRSIVRSVRTPDDRVLLFGGERVPAFENLASAESYTPAGGAIDLAEMPTARSWHTATRLRDGRVLILGGEGAGGVLVPSVLLYE